MPIKINNQEYYIYKQLSLESRNDLYLCKDNQDKFFILKKVKKLGRNNQNIYKEINLTKYLTFDKIIIPELDEDDTFYYILTPYIKGGDLYYYTVNNVLQLNEIKNIFKKMVDLICHIHQKNVIHLDLSLENFLIDENKDVYLIDFESAIYTENDNINFKDISYIKKTYSPPEIFNKKLYETSGKKIDVFSLGICLYSMLYKELPFNPDFIQYYKLYFEKTITNKNMTESLKFLLSHMLCVNVNERFTIEQVKNCEWLKN